MYFIYFLSLVSLIVPNSHAKKLTNLEECRLRDLITNPSAKPRPLTERERFATIKADQDGVFFDGVSSPRDRVFIAESYSDLGSGKTKCSSNLSYWPDPKGLPARQIPFAYYTSELSQRRSPAGIKRKLIIRFAFGDLAELNSDSQKTEIPKILVQKNAPAGTEGAVGYSLTVLPILRQMKHVFGADCYGALTTLGFEQIDNFATIAEMNLLEKQWIKSNKGKKVTRELREKLFAQTHMYRYAERIAMQSGHKITGIHLKGGHPVILKSYTGLDWQPMDSSGDLDRARNRKNRQQLDGLNEKYRQAGISLNEPNEPVYAKFDVSFDLAPSNK